MSASHHIAAHHTRSHPIFTPFSSSCHGPVSYVLHASFSPTMATLLGMNELLSVALSCRYIVLLVNSALLKALRCSLSLVTYCCIPIASAPLVDKVYYLAVSSEFLLIHSLACA